MVTVARVVGIPSGGARKRSRPGVAVALVAVVAAVVGRCGTTGPWPVNGSFGLMKAGLMPDVAAVLELTEGTETAATETGARTVPVPLS